MIAQKNNQEDLTAQQLRVLARLVREEYWMRKQDFDNLVTSIQQAGSIQRGEAKPARVTEVTPMDVKAIRQRLGKSQAEFARMIGVSVATLQNWEQGRRRPEGPGLLPKTWSRLL